MNQQARPSAVCRSGSKANSGPRVDHVQEHPHQPRLPKKTRVLKATTPSDNARETAVDQPRRGGIYGPGGDNRSRENRPPPRNVVARRAPIPAEVKAWLCEYRQGWNKISAVKEKAPDLGKPTVGPTQGAKSINTMTEDFYHFFSKRKWDVARSCRRQIFTQCMLAHHARGRTSKTSTHRVKFSSLVRQRRTLVKVVHEPSSRDLSDDPPCIVEQRSFVDRFRQLASEKSISEAGSAGLPEVLERRADRAICDAFRDGETHRLKALIRAGASPTFRRKPGESALHAAAYCGDVDLVNNLVFTHGVQSSRDVAANLPADLAALRQQWQVLGVLQRQAAHRSTERSTVEAFDKHVS